MTATGRSGSTPAATAAAQISASVATAISSTSVAPSAASAARAAGSGPACPDETCTDVATPRWVSGMPASTGTASAELMPGTTSTSTPASRQACTSSPPRP